MVQTDAHPPVTRKTISFPTELHEELAQQARDERRRFSPHVIKLLEGIFLPVHRMTVAGGSVDAAEGEVAQ